MNLTRRNFLKFSGLASLASAGALFGSISLLSGCKSVINKLKGTEQSTSICPFCSMGCGIKISKKNEQIVNIEGDPKHPINEGKLCAKGSAAFQLTGINNKRLTKVKYRAPYSANWQEISWEEAIKKIADNIKKIRDKTFKEYEGKNTINRTEGIALIAGSTLNNEEYYLLSKMARLLGIAYIDNESNLYRSSGSALASSFGYSAMTNHWMDFQNADVILIIGANPAESHPVSAKFFLKAKERGAKIIHVDPRFTRTSAIADYYVPLRPGTDVAFIGGIINFAFENNRIQKEYLLEYSNAAFLVNTNYRFINGLFNGFQGGNYKADAWSYETDRKGIPRIDKTFKNANTVFQITKNHFSRYTADTVSRITGCPAETFLKIADIFTSTHKPDKAASILYSSGATQHTVGTQNVRVYAILQMLMGNIGLAGGGLNDLKQGSNDQGAEDFCLNAHYLPGYLPAPEAEHSSLDSYIKSITPLTNSSMSINLPSRRNVQIINLLKAFYGDTANKENDYCFHWLPKTKQYSQRTLYADIKKSIIEGAVFTGTNPVMNVPNRSFKTKIIENLKWMIVTDMFETETSAFWKISGAKPEKIRTEVFLLPSASAIEKDGSVTNSGRWVQWRNKAVNPPGDAKSELWIFNRIFKQTQKLYAEDKNATFPDSVVYANWDYIGEKKEPDSIKVLGEINGYEWRTKKLVSEMSKLKDDGSTVSGNWLYCGSNIESGNMTTRKSLKDAKNKVGLFPKWAWSWPDNSRVLYNRASVDRNGKPWNKDKWVTQWDDEWEGDSVNGDASAGPADKNPFIMLEEGVGRIFAKDLSDGPLPEHYEPYESPVGNILNPVWKNPVCDKSTIHQLRNSGAYPYIATIYGMAENWQAGTLTENLQWLSELVPNFICEISKSLAEARGLKSGDKVEIRSARGKLSAYCLVSERIQPFVINGRKIEMVGIVKNSGGQNISNNYNGLTHEIKDPNTDIPENKAFLVSIAKGV